MPRSHLFSLQARRATFHLTKIAQDLHVAQTQMHSSSAMQDRLTALLRSVSPSSGPISVAQLRDNAHLSARLGAEQQRQSQVHQAAEAKSKDLLADMQIHMRQQRLAQDAAALALRQEQDQRAQKLDAARPIPRNDR